MATRQSLDADRVVDAAAAIADRDGLATLTLSAVAATLGVRTPSLYNHVDGLDDLHRRLTVCALDELAVRIREAAVGRSGEEAVHAIAVAHRRFASERPGLYAATVPTTEVPDDDIRRAGAAILATVFDALRGYGLDERAAIHATRSLRSAVHGFVSLEASGGFGLDVDVEESFAWMVELVADGIRHRP